MRVLILSMVVLTIGSFAGAEEFPAGWPRLSRFGLYRGGAAGGGLLGGNVSRVNLLCCRTPVGSKASQPVPPNARRQLVRAFRKAVRPSQNQ